MSVYTFIRGGGDLASGVALRLYRTGAQVIITELAQPLVVRRLASFAEAVYRSEFRVEGVTASIAHNLGQVMEFLENGVIPVLVDPSGANLAPLRDSISPQAKLVLIDARMLKRPPDISLDAADFFIGLGPGFHAGKNCHAVIETKRGHFMGRVIWDGLPEADSGIPDGIRGQGAERVLRAPIDGVFHPIVEIGDHIQQGAPIAEVAGKILTAQFSGMLRGLLHPGLYVRKGLKVGDLDPRDDPRFCTLVSDKSLAIGGGVLEAILARPELRTSYSQPATG